MEIKNTKQFRKDLKKLASQNKQIALLDEPIFQYLAKGRTLPTEYRDHPLTGNWRGYRDFHIGGKNSDWVVIYKTEKDTVYLVRTGSHSELF
jgi:mRNA interferase YafQ